MNGTGTGFRAFDMVIPFTLTKGEVTGRPPFKYLAVGHIVKISDGQNGYISHGLGPHIPNGIVLPVHNQLDEGHLECVDVWTLDGCQQHHHQNT